MWLRGLLKEIRMDSMLTEPTPLFSDSTGAIDWMKFQKITPGNNYILLAYHQNKEFVETGHVLPQWKKGKYNYSDLMTKASTVQDFDRLHRKLLGYDLSIQEEDDEVREHISKKAKTG